ncbi:hypothetical protein GLAREA_04050 [Glarea lozoyensis ATCC 20868]|uniref:Uncharacterized protein n=1 Tax=Glarea lozoyensis (strain ATCC 20868 / MF5171) TaxID=1116229 RepID=S3DXI7_GLAL2|nr:uncharacterized protein GLAREA_04050 [Glarea lozoyensis ATCC 20868]EPE31083.1 hypothetical protein GLAREA_04050 [Glarea lozoyensis ATCC 20868]
MVEAQTEQGEQDHASSPTPGGPAKNRRGIMEDYLYYATPPRAGLPQKIENSEELSTKPTRVHIGGFGNDVSILTQAHRNLFWVFPPPNNAAYEVDSHCRLPHLHPHIYPEFSQNLWSSKENSRDIGGDLHNTLQRGSSESVFDGLEMNVRPTHGLGLSDVSQEKEHDNRNPVSDANVTVHVREVNSPDSDQKYSPQYPVGGTLAEAKRRITNHDEKRDKNILKSPENEVYDTREYFDLNYRHSNFSGQPDFCKLCKTNHVPIPGPSGDGVWSLPDWFPENGHFHPWDACRAVTARLVAVQEALDNTKNGHQKHRDGFAEWNLHFHEKGRHWTTKHARDWGGWWRCRGDENAPVAERRCTHCHPAPKSSMELKDEERVQFKMASQKQTTPLKIQEEYLKHYLEHHSKVKGEIDKKAALAMLRRDGIPQIYGRVSTYQEQQGLMEPRSKLETSATERDLGGRLLAIDSTLMYQHPKKTDTSEEQLADLMPINHGDLHLL